MILMKINNNIIIFIKVETYIILPSNTKIIKRLPFLVQIISFKTYVLVFNKFLTMKVIKH